MPPADPPEVEVEVVAAWPRRHAARRLRLPAGSTVAQAVAAAALVGDAAGFDGVAIHGERVDADRVLADGDRVELLRPLQLDPMEARRRRASGAAGAIRRDGAAAERGED